MTAVVVARSELYDRAAGRFDELVRRVQPQDWSAPTPCSGWTVRDLVNHVAAENLWLDALLGGETIAEVGDRFSGDLLGSDPVAGWEAALRAGRAAAGSAGVADRVVELGAGPTTGAEYLQEVGADHLIHGWDLAVAIGADDTLDADLVTEVGGWFVTRENGYRSAGAVGPRPPVEHDGDPQTRLLAMFGRSRPADPLGVVRRFGEAFDAADLPAVMSLMTADCLFESTAPPDGISYRGRSEVARAFGDVFAGSVGARFITESMAAAGDLVVVQWRYDWAGEHPGHVRGVDLFRVRDGLVAEKRSYVKG
jgi:uncharacterized protein (TIGR03086 family)